MTSILKVDQIQTTAGAAPTAKDLGFAAGSVIQTVTEVDNTGISLTSSATSKFMDVAFTTKALNSIINVRFYTALFRTSATDGNRDIDTALALGFKTGSATSSSGDYTAITTYAPSRESITFSGSVARAFYSSDAFASGGTYHGRYNPIDTLYNEESFSPSLAAGTTIRVACFAKQDYNLSSTIRLGASTSGISDSGTTSCLTITEISS